jgi:hypothetical protein
MCAYDYSNEFMRLSEYIVCSCLDTQVVCFAYELRNNAPLVISHMMTSKKCSGFFFVSL